MKLVQKVALAIRSRFHPLHHLRRNRFYQRVLQPLFDIPLPANLCMRHPVYLRLLTHFSFLFLSQKMEERLLSTLVKIIGHMEEGKHTFVDVGANIGLYTWHALNAKPNLHVAAFEPDPLNGRLLKKTKQKWGASNLSLHFSAASNANGQATFSQDLLSSATGSLNQTERSFAEQHYGQRQSLIEVETMTLDSAVANLPPPALLKIDVEGHEKEVLEGAGELLERHRPILLIESFGEKAKEFREILEPLDYQFWDADHACTVSRETMNYLCLVPGETGKLLLEDLVNLGFSIDC